MKRRNFLALLLGLCLALTACGSAAPTDEGRMESDYGYSADLPGETSAAMDLSTEGAIPNSAPQTDRKLIKTVSIDAETEDFDGLSSALEARIAALGGYVQSRQTGTYSRDRRWSRMVVRIPADRLGDFVSHVKENANVLSTAEDTQDVTVQYSDTEAKITALNTERSRLLELLAEAQNLSEILEIEARLSDVTYELERYESRKRTYDNQIDYATVELSVNEVKTLTPTAEPTVWERIRTGFADSLEGVSSGFVDLFVLLIAGSPYLLVYGAAISLLVLILKKLRRKKQNLQQSPPSQTT